MSCAAERCLQPVHLTARLLPPPGPWGGFGCSLILVGTLPSLLYTDLLCGNVRGQRSGYVCSWDSSVQMLPAVSSFVPGGLRGPGLFHLWLLFLGRVEALCLQGRGKSLPCPE